MPSKGSIFHNSPVDPSSRVNGSPFPHEASNSSRVLLPGYMPRKLAGSMASVGVWSGGSATGRASAGTSLDGGISLGGLSVATLVSVGVSSPTSGDARFSFEDAIEASSSEESSKHQVVAPLPHIPCV